MWWNLYHIILFLHTKARSSFMSKASIKVFSIPFLYIWICKNIMFKFKKLILHYIHLCVHIMDQASQQLPTLLLSNRICRKRYWRLNCETLLLVDVYVSTICLSVLIILEREPRNNIIDWGVVVSNMKHLSTEESFTTNFQSSTLHHQRVILKYHLHCHHLSQLHLWLPFSFPLLAYCHHCFHQIYHF